MRPPPVRARAAAEQARWAGQRRQRSSAARPQQNRLQTGLLRAWLAPCPPAREALLHLHSTHGPTQCAAGKDPQHGVCHLRYKRKEVIKTTLWPLASCWPCWGLACSAMRLRCIRAAYVSLPGCTD